MAGNAVVAGTIEYLIGVDDTALIRGLQQAAGKVSQQGRSQGDAFGRSLNQGLTGQLQTVQAQVRQQLSRALANLPTVELNADSSDVDKALAEVRTTMTSLSGQDLRLGADTSEATGQLGELRSQLQRIAAEHPEVEVRASAAQATQELGAVESAARHLDGLRAEIEARADTSSAEAALRRLSESGGRVDVDVDADTSAAEDRIGGLGEGAGGAAGERIGGDVVGGITGKLGVLGAVGGPVAGVLVGAGVGLGALFVKAISDGMDQRADNALFQARTGLDDATVAKYATAAGESYASNFGDSLSANLEIARSALNTGLLGGDSTSAQIQTVTNQLDTVATLLGVDIPEVARAAGQAVRTGLVKDTTQGLDLIARASQLGLNVSEDLLDTITEYGTQFRRAGIDGQTAMGLISQLVKGGARDTDLAADAVKEFVLRLSDVTNTGAQDALTSLGLNAEEVSRQFLAGGDSADSAMQRVVQAITSVEDPVVRNTALINLFGTQAEDLGGAINALDLSKARGEFAGFDGTVQRAMDTLGSTTQAKIETAKRGIETATNGIKVALADAFAPQIAGAADWITTHRGEVTQFLFTVGNGLLDLARSAVETAATSTEAFGRFVGTTGPQVLDMIRSIIAGMDSIPLVDLSDTLTQFDAMSAQAKASFSTVESSTAAAADKIRSTAIPAIDGVQERFSALEIPAVTQARFADATNALSFGLAGVSDKAEETRGSLDTAAGTIDRTTDAGKTLDGQLRTVSASLLDQAVQGAALGQTQEELTGRFNEGRDALIGQLQQLGLTRDAAEKLAAQYGLVPGKVDTIVSDAGTAASVKAEVERLNGEIGRVQDRTVTITARLALGSSAGKTSNGWSGGTVAKAMGGSVHGPGSGTSDDIPAWLSNGEHVWTDAEVRAAGGHERVKNLRRAALSGELPAFAQGGPVGDNLRVDMTDPGAFQQSAGSAWDQLLGAAQSAADSAARAAQAADEAGGATAGPPSGTGSGWAWQVATIKKAFPNIAITSTTRPGAKTVSGNTSYHARGRAIDMSPSMAAFNWIAQNFPNTAELIFSPAGARQLKNGRSHIYSGAVKAMHYNHVHWAYDQGGLAEGAGYLPKLTPKPERVLSPQQTKDFGRLVDALTAGQIGAGGGKTVQVTNHNQYQLMDDAQIALLARQEALEMAGYLGMAGI
ncbi:phage tail tape measure protein [Kineococcus endophyticus]|uniref:Phage tail tape measure protein n=1 Tax=Kineococcus endophyticus TaxID=1181883 RepID=A0ABV3P158_9ACTN